MLNWNIGEIMLGFRLGIFEVPYMSLTLRRPRAAIRKFDSTQDYWYGARIVVNETGSIKLITYWKNPEIDGVWEFHYKVSRGCFDELMRQELIEHDGSKNKNFFTLSKKGLKRLG